jgi:hypothetical protein
MTGETVGFTDEQIDRLFAQTGNISMLSYNGDEGWSVDALTQFISDRERARA